MTVLWPGTSFMTGNRMWIITSLNLRQALLLRQRQGHRQFANPEAVEEEGEVEVEEGEAQPVPGIEMMMMTTFLRVAATFRVLLQNAPEVEEEGQEAVAVG